MKLLTKEVEKLLPPLRATEYDEDPICQVHFFHPMSSWDWFATEYDAEDKVFFGWVHGNFDELGYFSLDELESVKIMGLGMERDIAFKPTPLSVVKERYI